MRVVETVAEMVAARAELEAAGSVGLVPTMGYLHAGHLSLARQAHAENAVSVASIFVNPTQFGPAEDLSRYPRNLSGDLELLEGAGIDIVFTPAADDMYPPGFSTYVDPVGTLVSRLEGASRPGHFRGVATVVAKLFQIVRPDIAYFGQKDAQQAAVLTRMAADLNFPVILRVLPIVREPDGLAMSSRNSYLGPEDRAAATVLCRALAAGREAFIGHPANGAQGVIRAMADVVDAEPRAQLDYADVSDPTTLEPLTELRAPALLAIAARVGSARLIDNYLLRADGTWDTGVLVS